MKKAAILLTAFVCVFVAYKMKRAPSVQDEQSNEVETSTSTRKFQAKQIVGFKKSNTTIADRQGRPTQMTDSQTMNPSNNQVRGRESVPSTTQRTVSSIPAHNPAKSASAVVKGSPYFDPSDLSLLQRAAELAKSQGSRVAYIGHVEELYAYDPRFFEIKTGSDGRKSIFAKQVESIDKVPSPQGETTIRVQREPYPIPPSPMVNYNILHQAIVRATDDGATVINLTSLNIDRSRLESSIAYARSRGAVVITIPPPALRQ